MYMEFHGLFPFLETHQQICKLEESWLPGWNRVDEGWFVNVSNPETKILPWTRLGKPSSTYQICKLSIDFIKFFSTMVEIRQLRKFLKLLKNHQLTKHFLKVNMKFLLLKFHIDFGMFCHMEIY